MRKTATLDDDVAQMLRDAMHQTGKSFKETLNATLRTALTQKAITTRRRFKVEALPMALRPGIDPSSMNKLSDDFETEEVVAKLRCDT